jgi:hypothetical protein
MGKVRAFLLSAEVVVLTALAALLVAWYLTGPAAFLLYFDWPAGAIWANLIASVLCVGFALWKLRVQAIAHHAEALALAARHHREHMALVRTQHVAAMTALRASHADLKAHTARQLAAVYGAGRDDEAAGAPLATEATHL